MEKETIPTQCEICHSPLVERKGTSKRTGKSYQFWGCSNYPNCNYIWRPEKRGTKETPLKEHDQGEQILEALRKVYAKLLEIEKEQRAFYQIFSEKQDKE